MTWKILLLSIIAVGINADQGQPEVNLFHKADTNNDYKLTRHELDDLFLEFDQNNDSIITPTEFVSDWTNFNIGGAQQAQALFTRADTNDDHVIDAKDIPAIFAFFDQNGDGHVDISEFLTMWGSLKKHPTGTGSVDISVHVPGGSAVPPVGK